MSKGKADETLTKKHVHLEYAFDYGINLRDRVILINEEISDVTFQFVDAAMSEMEKASKAAVTVKINSGGGSVNDTFAIVSRLQKSKCQINTEGYGSIKSAAILLMSCGVNRKLSRYAEVMHHEMSYDAGDDKLSAHGDYYRQGKRLENTFCKFLEDHTIMPAEFWFEAGQRRDLFLTPEECIEYGLVHELF